MRISVEIDDRALRQTLKRLARVGDVKPVYREVDRFVGEEFRRQFETGGAHGGRGWKPLAPSTRKRRANRRSNPGGNRGGVDRPLWNTGELKASMQEVGPNSIRVITDDEYVRGSRLRRAAIHQKGTGQIPARPIITPEIKKRTIRRAREIAQRRLREAIGGTGPGTGTSGA